MCFGEKKLKMLNCNSIKCNGCIMATYQDGFSIRITHRWERILNVWLLQGICLYVIESTFCFLIADSVEYIPAVLEPECETSLFRNTGLYAFATLSLQSLRAKKRVLGPAHQPVDNQSDGFPFRKFILLFNYISSWAHRRQY